MSKGEATRERIVRRAVALASRDGLSGVTIGSLAETMRLSKSGLFAHFGSKEELQMRVLQRAAEQFTEEVLKPALAESRGEARLRRFMSLWLTWADTRFPGGCPLLAASVELDDKPGALRDQLDSTQRALLETIARIAQSAIETRQFRESLDVKQFAHDLYAQTTGYLQLKRLLRMRGEDARIQAAFERLVHWARR